MALEKLTNQLDQLTHADLGIDFDENAVWSKLEGRLSKRKRVIAPWMVAAAIPTLLVLFPFVLLRQGTSESSQLVSDATAIAEPIEKVLTVPDQSSVVVDVAEKVVASQETKSVSPILTLEKKQVKATLASVEMPQPDLKLQVIEAPSKKIKPLFAAQDISIIQASLERPSIREKGRKMTIRAQWQKSPTKSNTENQALKIKLYEASNQ